MQIRLIAILLLCSKLVFSQSTVTYYFNSSYRLVTNPKNATYRAEVTTLTKIIEGQADINVYTISDTLIQRYSYSDVKKGTRRGSLLLFYETGEPKRMIVYNTEGQPIEDKQFLQDGKIDVITKYQGKVITEYLHFYYPNQQLHNVTKFVSGGLIDSSITYYQSGGKRSIITYFPAKTVKTKIIYNEDGSVLSQVIYNEKGVVTSELNSNAANSHPDDFDILKQAIEYKGGNTALYQYIGAEIQYPTAAKDNAITGTTYIKFFVSPTGEVSNASIFLPTFPLLDFEALRVVHNMPSYVIGKQENTGNGSWYRLPVKFALQQ
ncbi:MAG: energy transducer TonB [Chitinophagaceae bacterium]